MQSVSNQFKTYANSNFRPISWRVLMSFLKNIDSTTTFFTIGTSKIGGRDIIKGPATNVVQAWDKYNYDDFTGRVIDMDVTIEQQQPLGGATLAIADITLDNHDDYFSPNNTASPIYGYVLPFRPIRLYAGFQNENIPLFVGLTEEMPEIDEQKKTAKFHCIDFIQQIFNYPLDAAVLYTNYRTDQVISALLQIAGIASNQFVLDTGLNVIPYTFFDVGTTLGDAIRPLVQAEMGSFYIDEYGMIRFSNRYNWTNNNTVLFHFDKSNSLQITTPTQQNVINVVEVDSDVRTAEDNQKVWELSDPIVIPPNGSVVIPAALSDPVISVDTPSPINVTSVYSTNDRSDGSGTIMDGSVTLTTAQYANSYQMTFSNSSATTAYVTKLILYAILAKVTSKIHVRNQDNTSVANYGEQVVSLNNNFIQDAANANSMSLVIIQDNKDYNPMQELIVKGMPHLQVGDLVSVTTESGKQTYYVTKIVHTLAGNTGFLQTITLIKKTVQSYFRIGISTIGGTDKIAP